MTTDTNNEHHKAARENGKAPWPTREDFRKGAAHFLEKRSAQFTGN